MSVVLCRTFGPTSDVLAVCDHYISCIIKCELTKSMTSDLYKLNFTNSTSYFNIKKTIRSCIDQFSEPAYVQSAMKVYKLSNQIIVKMYLAKKYAVFFKYKNVQE